MKVGLGGIEMKSLEEREKASFKFCPACGAELRKATDNYCRRCGARQNTITGRLFDGHRTASVTRRTNLPPPEDGLAMTNNTIEITRACYEAYVKKDRTALEALLAEDFHFTSPVDNRLDRDTYFARCCPNSETTERFDFIHLFPDGNRAFVTYEGRGAKGHRFSNDVFV